MKKVKIIIIFFILLISIFISRNLFINKQLNQTIQIVNHQTVGGENVVFYENSKYDINNDGENDNLWLVLTPDNNVNIEVNNVSYFVNQVDSENQIIGNISSDHFEYDILYKNNNIIIVYTYWDINKWGSISNVVCLKYEDETLENIWNLRDEVNKLIKVIDFNSENLILTFNREDKELELKLNNNDFNTIQSIMQNRKFEEYSQLNVNLKLFTEIKIYDINSDNEDEIITKAVFSIEDNVNTGLFFVWKCSDKQIKLIDYFFKDNDIEKSEFFDAFSR